MCPTFPTKLPLPISTLHFTSDNLLDTLLVDAQPLNLHHQTVYRPRFAIQTIEDETSVYQLPSSTSSGSNENSSLVGCIKWHPKHAHSTLVSVFNQTLVASDFLKKSVLGGTRKFHVPGQSSPLKWKHVGNRYECTLCSHACTAHRAVAIFDPPTSTPTRNTTGGLSLYVSSVTSGHINGDEFEIDHDGDLVDSTLLVYLILTCILISNPNHHHAPSRTHTRLSTEHRHVKLQSQPVQTYSSSSSHSTKSTSRCALKSGPIEVEPVKGRIDLIGDDDGGDDLEMGGSMTSRAPSSPFSPFSPITITTTSSHSTPSPKLVPPSSPTMLYPPSPNMYSHSHSHLHSHSHSHSPMMPPSPLYPTTAAAAAAAAAVVVANVIVVPSPGSNTYSLPASPITPISSASSSSHHNYPRASPRGGFIEPIAAINSETFFPQPQSQPQPQPQPQPQNNNFHPRQHYLSQNREYAPTPTKPPMSSTASMFATMSGQMYAFAHAMGRSRSNGSTTTSNRTRGNSNTSSGNNSTNHLPLGTSTSTSIAVGHKVHRTSSSSSTGHRTTSHPSGPRSSSSSSSGPRSATSCFFHFHPKSGTNSNNNNNNNNTTTNNSTNNLNGTGAEMAPGPNAITPYYLPPAPVQPPPPVPPPPPPPPLQIQPATGTSSPLRNALLLDTRSPIVTTTTNGGAGGATLASPSALTTPLPPSPMIRYTTEMYHLQFSDSMPSPAAIGYEDPSAQSGTGPQYYNYGTMNTSPVMLSVPIPPLRSTSSSSSASSSSPSPSSPARVRRSSPLPPSPLMIPPTLVSSPTHSHSFYPQPTPVTTTTTASTMPPNLSHSSAAAAVSTPSISHTTPTSASTITSPTLASPTTTNTNVVTSPTRPVRIFQEVAPPLGWDEVELPPAYSEIEWTVRIREPRRGRQQQRRDYDDDQVVGAGGVGLQLVTV